MTPTGRLDERFQDAASGVVWYDTMGTMRENTWELCRERGGRLRATEKVPEWLRLRVTRKNSRGEETDRDRVFTQFVLFRLEIDDGSRVLFGDVYMRTGFKMVEGRVVGVEGGFNRIWLN